MSDQASIETAVSEAAPKLGYDSLKPEQFSAIVEFVKGRDVFVILPTGFGKSLCYASLPLVYDIVQKPEEPSIVIVVTPLISIMEDQVRY